MPWPRLRSRQGRHFFKREPADLFQFLESRGISQNIFSETSLVVAILQPTHPESSNQGVFKGSFRNLAILLLADPVSDDLPIPAIHDGDHMTPASLLYPDHKFATYQQGHSVVHWQGLLKWTAFHFG
jgi:hypothetical protein